MAKYTINDTTLVAIADAIRAKSGTAGGIDPANMAALIAAIEAGGGSGAKIATGTVTTNGTISSGRYVLGVLDFKPKFAMLYRSEYPTVTRVLFCTYADNAIPYKSRMVYRSSSSAGVDYAAKDLSTIKTGYLLFAGGTATLEYYTSQIDAVMDGTYTWVAIG